MVAVPGTGEEGLSTGEYFVPGFDPAGAARITAIVLEIISAAPPDAHGRRSNCDASELSPAFCAISG